MSGELIIGLMSGTSVDGIDAVLVEFESESKLQVVASVFSAYEDDLQIRINQLAQQSITPRRADYSELDIELAHLYAQISLELISKSGVSKNSISAIANHGQTIAHEPNNITPFSLQIGDPQLIANLTGLTTISQFRQTDLKIGGQGAPLMPAFHQAVVKTKSGVDSTYILNLGGIANITALGENVIGFDTGPANTLLNQWVKQCQNKSYDKNGLWAKSGEVIPELLTQLLSDPYFMKTYPKSTGPDYFNLDWFRKLIGDLEQYADQDIQATLLEFSVESIAKGFELITATQGNIYVCGGGVHNHALMSRLKNRLIDFDIKLSDEFGVPADWVEATGFAWLGFCNLHGITSNLPSVTGASRKIVLGERFKPNISNYL